MKKLLLFWGVTSILVGCNSKFIPGKSATASTNHSTILAKTDSITSSTSTAKALIVINGDGQILTPQEKLPANEHLAPNYPQIARAFTPAQKANLTLRFKMIPPKVLYVPEIYTAHSLKGTYSIYKKKFWYWKKPDGLFYLDEAYYK